MSQPEESDKILKNYHSAIESFENVELLSKNKHVTIVQVHQELVKLTEKVDTLISEEGVNGSHLVILFQLKQLVLELTTKMQQKITTAPSDPFVPNKLQQSIKSTENKAQSIVNSMVETPRVSGLKEIAGLWDVKKVLKSLVILPRNQPQLFVNQKACNSVLLFGPPGTGKTRLVHALASEANGQLYSVSVGVLVSPLIGQTEKNMQVLFDHVLTSEEFSILFIDEVDGFCRTRHTSEQDHTRRMKTELMCQISKLEEAKNTLLICATNCPWDLDTAFMRRFQKRFYIPLPNIIERHDLFQLFTKNTPLETHTDHLDLLIKKTEGFSGSDLSDLVQSALSAPITELEDTKIWKLGENGLYEPVVMAEDFNLDEVVCSDLSDLPYRTVKARPVQMLDLFNALDSITPTVSVGDIKKYETFISSR